ncbi:hypothetical protein ACFQ0B_09575 [Nonomuraea thailandensis]
MKLTVCLCTRAAIDALGPRCAVRLSTWKSPPRHEQADSTIQWRFTVWPNNERTCAFVSRSQASNAPTSWGRGWSG